MLPNTFVIVLHFSPLWHEYAEKTHYEKDTQEHHLPLSHKHTHTHSLSEDCAEPCHCIGEHLCHCCGNSYGETSILFHIFPISLHEKNEQKCRLHVVITV